MNDVTFPTDFDSDTHPILYHYCSSETFLSILQSKSLWMSDINTMNDFGEMHWAYDRFIEAANSVLDIVGVAFVDKLDNVISQTQLNILPTLAALSKDGDVLSQWRAYANDGAGFCIGFDSKQIEKLSVRIGDICYDHSEQVAHFRTLLLSLNEVHNQLPDNEKDGFLIEAGSQFGTDMALFKNPAFAEEKEVRLIRALTVEQKQEQWILRDVGGTGEKTSKRKQKVQFRAAANGGLVAFIALPFSGLGPDCIKKVVLGPKNPCSGAEVSMALDANGFHSAKIEKSASTYR